MFLKFVIFKLFKNHNLVFPAEFSSEETRISNPEGNQYKNCILKRISPDDYEDPMETEELKKLE